MHTGPRHSTAARPLVAKSSGVALSNYASLVESQLARIDVTRATLESLAETYGTTPVQAATDEMLFDLRRVAEALLPAARAADSEIRRNPNADE
jgi:hypothetical protein